MGIRWFKLVHVGSRGALGDIHRCLDYQDRCCQTAVCCSAGVIIIRYYYYGMRIAEGWVYASPGCSSLPDNYDELMKLMT